MKKDPIEVKLGLNEKNFYVRIPKRMKGIYPFDMENRYVEKIVNLISKVAVKLQFSTGDMKVEVNPFSSQEFHMFKFDFIDDENYENRGLLEELNDVLSKYSTSCCSQCVYTSVYDHCNEKYKYLFFTGTGTMDEGFNNFIYED